MQLLAMFSCHIFLFSFFIYQCLGYNDNNLNYQVNYEDLFDYDLYDTVIDPEKCTRHMEQMNRLEFFDASFRIPQGILTGNWENYGNYFQCLDIRQEITDDVIEGKHCMINFQNAEDFLKTPWFTTGFEFTEADKEIIRDIKNETKKQVSNLKAHNMATESVRSEALAPLTSLFRLGVCIPKSCSVRQALQPYFNNTLIQINYGVEFCRLPGDKPLVIGDYVCMAIFAVVGVITLLSTAYELWQLFGLKTEPSKLHWLYKSCSIYGNTKALCTFGTSKPGSLDCLDGIRSFSILWVIYGHAAYIFVGPSSLNIYDALVYIQAYRSFVLGAAEYSVDTFFMLSGLLLVYISCGKMKQGQLLRNLHLYYINRIMRLFPLLALTILLQATVLHHVADGPYWRFLSQNVDKCRQYWWAALLYMQNYYNYPNDCLGHSWYLSVDMQIYVLSPLLLFWFLGNKKYGWLAAAIAFSGSMIASSTFIFLVLPDTSNGQAFYVNTLTRAPAFIIGMVFGYLLHCCRRKKIVIPLWIVFPMWIAVLALFGVLVYAAYAESSELNDALINSFSKPSWCMGIGWLIFACVHGYGGPINWLLSLTIFKFISRISYALYLLHSPVQIATLGASSTPVYFQEINIFFRFVYDLGCTIIVSIPAYVIFDMPFANVLKRLLAISPKAKSPKEETPKANFSQVEMEQEETVHTKQHAR